MSVVSLTTLAQRAVAALDEVVAALPQGERREGQRQMAAAVAEAIEQNGCATVQAGTGIGKSLGYAIPSVLSGRRTVVATATKALQDQLAGQDLPFLAEHLGVEINFAVLKGRSNYLCLQRLDEARRVVRLPLKARDRASAVTRRGDYAEELDAAALDAVARTAEGPTTGERSHLGVSLSDPQWRGLTVTRNECPGKLRCRRGQDCFAEQARSRASDADVVIVNQHLYALSLRFPWIIDDHATVVIDEAHQFEEAVSSALGRMISPGRFTALARSGLSLRADDEACQAVADTSARLRKRLAPLAGRRLNDDDLDDLADTLAAASLGVANLKEKLLATAKAPSLQEGDAALRAVRAADSLLDDLNALRPPDDNDIVWVEESRPSPALRTTPLRIDELLAEHLWAKRTAVLTSATIPPALRERTGMPETTAAVDVGSPFDYADNALLYCPRWLPVPGRRDPGGRRLAELETLIRAAEGRTLALFTSYYALNAAARAMQGRLPWPVLLQGAKARSVLLEEFASDEHACLFATISFWQGVDVPGRTCSLVAIDKLPFPRPDDPVLQARREQAGDDGWRLIDLARASTLLTQGAGRLVRTARDAGVVAVLDSRLVNSYYGRSLIQALPPMGFTSDRREALYFLKSAISR